MDCLGKKKKVTVTYLDFYVSFCVGLIFSWTLGGLGFKNETALLNNNLAIIKLSFRMHMRLLQEIYLGQTFMHVEVAPFLGAEPESDKLQWEQLVLLCALGNANAS